MARKKPPVVLRYEGMDPIDIGNSEAHCFCKGDDPGPTNWNTPKRHRLISS